MSADIVKAGLAVIREGRLLLCRKSRDTSLLITPGGKVDPGESDEACLVREVAEELGSGVRLTNVRYIDTYRDRAAGALDRVVEVRLYQAELEGDEPRPCAEIAELVWFSPATCDPEQLSLTLRRRIIPDLVRRGLLHEGL